MISVAIKLQKNVTRANACLFPLLMLYYEGGRLKGLWFPSGIEIPTEKPIQSCQTRLKGLWFPSGIEMAIRSLLV